VTPVQFYAIFIPAVVLYALFIYFVGTRLYEKLPQRVFFVGVLIVIGGIIAGVVMMFQPFVFAVFPIGFFFVFVSLFTFMVWSHIQPRTRPATTSPVAEATGESEAVSERAAKS
jgi:hypothetical protein